MGLTREYNVQLRDERGKDSWSVQRAFDAKDAAVQAKLEYAGHYPKYHVVRVSPIEDAPQPSGTNEQKGEA
jgi:hypothetical protein